MTAEQYLRQIRKIDTIIVNKLKDHRRWVSLAEGLGGFSAGERVQATRNLHSGADAIAEYIDIEAEIKALKQKREAIIATIEQLTADEYDVIYAEFVDGLMVKEIPSHLKMSHSWVRDKKRQGLEHVQRMIDERG